MLGFGLTWLLLITTLAVYHLTSDLVGSDPIRASESVKSLLPISAAVIGLPLIVWRLVILNRQTITAEAKTQIDRETHYTSIFSRSVDQLGQTRELKESVLKEGVYELITRTVANIEVRLGGIHSLARLAEESSRDRTKIESILLAYVRENSWSDKLGTTSVRPIRADLSPDWENDYRFGTVTAETNTDLSMWRDNYTSQTDKDARWAQQLPETRVDVSEAIDAIPSVGVARPIKKGKFYECLFVGRSFDSTTFRSYSFERCTFVRCEFALSDDCELEIDSSQLFSCTLQGRNSKASLYACDVVDFSVRELKNSDLRIVTSHAYELALIGLENTTIDMSSTTSFKGRLYAKRDLELSANYSTFVDFLFLHTKLSHKSDLTGCVFVDTNLSYVDLSEVSEIDGDVLRGTIGDRKTIEPAGLRRPASWSPYDAKEDEIPF